MTWERCIIGFVLLTSTAKFLITVWDPVINPPVPAPWDHRKVRKGMTLAEVETVMGGEGKPQIVYISGSLNYWREHDYFKHRWEDAFTTVDVSFQGPNGHATVVDIETRPKPPPEPVDLWVPRIVFALLALLGLWLMATGLLSRPRPPAADSPPA